MKSTTKVVRAAFKCNTCDNVRAYGERAIQQDTPSELTPLLNCSHGPARHSYVGDALFEQTTVTEDRLVEARIISTEFELKQMVRGFAHA